MATRNPEAVELKGDEFEDKTLKDIILKSEAQGRHILRPHDPEIAARLKKIVHGIVCERLEIARGKMHLSNDKINRILFQKYLDTEHKGKAWIYTNAVDRRKTYLLSPREVELIAEILDEPKVFFGLHLKVIPWSMEDQAADRKARRKTKPATPKVAKSKKSQAVNKLSQAAPLPPPEVYEAEFENQISYTPPAPPKRPATKKPAPAPVIPTNASDLKISHSEGRIWINGKIWCDNNKADKLGMIVAMKLINQARHDQPWCYEITGEIYPYQLYGLMHVLYDLPKVVSVKSN